MLEAYSVQSVGRFLIRRHTRSLQCCLGGLIKNALLAVGRRKGGSAEKGGDLNLSHLQMSYSQFHKS
jgi:hypothetical protein